MKPEDAAAFWDARYAQGLIYGTEPTSVAHRLVEVFRAHGVRTLLDAGCGSGRDALLYAREGFAVTGLDLSANALRWARDRARAAGLPVTYLHEDLFTTTLLPGSFDAVVAVHLLHLERSPDRQAMLNRLWLLARDGGLIALANYSTAEPGFTTWAPGPEPNTRIDPKGKLVHFFDAAELEVLLPPDRFEVLTREEVDLAEVPDSGLVVHREWLVIARKVRAC